MEKALFNSDQYITPPGRERLLHRLMLRSRAYYVLSFAGTILHYWPIARRGGFDLATWSRAAGDVMQMLERCGARFHIDGLANIRKADGPVVFVSNHMSTMETLILPAIIFPHKKPVFVIKEQLQAVPLFGMFVRECIAVSRNNPSEDFRQVMNRGTEKIRQGCSVIVFPQATRSVTFDESRFNTLGIKLARKAGVPVVPVALKTDFWGNGRLIKDFGPLHLEKPVHFEFGTPFSITGSGKAEHQEVVSFIRTRMERWQEADGKAD